MKGGLKKDNRFRKNRWRGARHMRLTGANIGKRKAALLIILRILRVPSLGVRMMIVGIRVGRKRTAGVRGIGLRV